MTRNVAVVGFARAPHVRRTDGTTNGVEMLMPCFAQPYAELGLQQPISTGATNKPLIRVHTAGSVGGSTAVATSNLVKSGKHRRVLTMAWEKQSESNAMWALSIPVPFTKPVGAGAGGYFAQHVRAYIRRSGAPTHIGAMVAVKDRLNGLATRWPICISPTSPWKGAGIPDALVSHPFRRNLPVLGRRGSHGHRR